jgi:biotin carboxylase
VVIAKAAKALGLPHLNPTVADRATNKLKRITCFQKKGVLCPKFASASSFREAEEKSKNIGFPLVIKPIDNAGARGVKTINSLEELRVGMKESLSYSKHHVVLLEEKLQGEEISTESVIVNEKIYTTGFGDRNYSRAEEFKPYFVEDGHNVGSRLPLAKQAQIIKAVEKAIKALGINWGVAKGDILINRRGIYVLEMAARTSAGWFAAGTVPLATGVNILKPLLQMAVGLPVDEADLLPKFHRAACQRYIIPTREGKFVRLEGVAKARRMPGVKMLDIFHQPLRGELVSKSKNGAERFGHLIAEGRDIDEATRRCERAIRQIKIILT